jgi:predicted benzoate:H+ symporter BenE
VELVQEISTPVIALAVGQVSTAAVALMASVIALSHQVPGSVRIITLLVAAGLTEVLLDRQVTVEVPAWEAPDSATVGAEADAVAVAHVVAVADVEDDKRIEEET